MDPLLEEKRKPIADLCARRGVARLEAFGSALREDFDPDDSDLDLLVEFQPMEAYARVEAYFGLLDDLRGMFGREIDLVMVGAVRNRYVAQDIQRTKQPLYAASSRDAAQDGQQVRLESRRDFRQLRGAQGEVRQGRREAALGAVGIYTASQKIRTGLQQLMAGSRNFNLSTITRRDLMSLSEECEKVTGIPYVMRAYRKEAEKILAQ